MFTRALSVVIAIAAGSGMILAIRQHTFEAGYIREIPICFEELAAFSVLPSSASWPNVSRINNPLFSQVSQPAFVALPKSSNDIADALRCANKHSIGVAVKSGGHSFAGYSSINSPGFMINLKFMKRVEWIDDTVVKVQAGATWIDVYSAFKKRGGLWVVTGGLCPSVGVAGFTLGGGVGPSVRTFGMAADNLLSASVVVANGSSVVKASPYSNEDLYWALRGSGGGNFGVVTELEFRVFRGPSLYTFARFCYDSSNIESVRSILERIAAENAQLSRLLNIDITYNAREFCLWIVWQGPSTQLNREISPIVSYRSSPKISTRIIREFDCFHELIEDYAQEKGYTEYSDDPYTIKNCLINSRSMQLLPKLMPIDAIPPQCQFTMIHFGGKVNDFAKNYTAFPWRDTQYMLDGSCSWKLGDERTEKESHKFLTQYFSETVRPLCSGAYVNFIDRKQQDWAISYYGDNLPKLQKIKARWNAGVHGVLHFPQEIPLLTTRK